MPTEANSSMINVLFNTKRDVYQGFKAHCNLEGISIKDKLTELMRRYNEGSI